MSKPYMDASRRDEIAKSYKAGEPIKVIAHRFGVHLSYPSLLAKRRNLKLRKRSARKAQS